MLKIKNTTSISEIKFCRRHGVNLKTPIIQEPTKWNSKHIRLHGFGIFLESFTSDTSESWRKTMITSCSRNEGSGKELSYRPLVVKIMKFCSEHNASTAFNFTKISKSSNASRRGLELSLLNVESLKQKLT